MSSLEAQRAGWLRFSEVKEYVPDGKKLYRSSAPNYKKLPSGDHDSSQNLTQTSVDFLSKSGIDGIISFNKYSYNRDMLARLVKANIKYKHFAVEDFSAPSVEQLKEANSFYVENNSALVHCGYGHGRTGTGITCLQIGTVNGQKLDPPASEWWGSRGNHVEKRRQMSVLAELRSVLLQNKSQGVPNVSPKKNFAIINFATGYYLAVSEDNKTIIALSPETVERGPKIKRQFLWAIERSKTGSDFTLSNRVTYTSFANTKSTGAAADDLIGNEPVAKDLNNLFSFTEVPDIGRYIISPAGNDGLALSIEEPDDSQRFLNQSKQMSAILSAKNEDNKFGLWILLPQVSSPVLTRL